MKPHIWVFLGLVVLAINNWILITYLGSHDHFIESSSATNSKLIDRGIEPTDSNLSQLVYDGKAAESEKPNIELKNQPDFREEFREFAASQEFAEIMNEYTLAQSRRGAEKQNEFQSMTAQELLSVYLSTDSSLDKQSALSLLNGKYDQLETYEIKQLYQSLDATSRRWNGTELLNVLLERDDPDALVWVKQEILNADSSNNISRDVFEIVYEKDPEFISNYVRDLPLDVATKQGFFFSLLSTESELAKIFLEKNIDEILETGNTTNLNFIGYNASIDLDSQQEARLVDFFGSSKKDTREFATALARNIDDIELLREGFNKLTRDREQSIFLSQLLVEGKDTSKGRLAIELAERVDNPRLQRYIERL